MGSSEINTNDERNHQQQSSEPTLCSNGCGFFGTAATKGLCSKCYIEFIKTITPTQPLPSVALSIKATPDPVVPVELEQNLPQGMSSLSLNAKKNRCVKCNKKIGLLGFKCRCGNTFCGMHRYAEEHGCDFDYKTKGRNELLKSNPGVKSDKLERL